MKLFSVPAAIVAVIISIVTTMLVSFILGGHVSLYVSPPYSFEDIPDLTGNVAIVTGGNTGIGYVTVRELAKKGAKVFLAARNEIKGIDAVNRIKAELRDLPGANLIEFIHLDLGSLAEVRKFAKEFSSRQLKLDMLILNAGIMATPFGLTVDGIETQIGTNHMGHFLLVNLLTPIIKESKSRIVHVSSIMHQSSHPEGIKISSFYEESGYIPL
jgi:NAD(P)-dependent dehydrogenase (short-subunit alcohol dehydrogenase family)